MVRTTSPSPNIVGHRLAKAEVNEAIDQAEAKLVKAAGPDKRISEANAKSLIDSLDDPKEQAAVEAFHKFAAARSTQEPGSQLSIDELKKASAFMKKEMIADHDANANGLSEAEIGNMSKTSQLMVRFAQSQHAKRHDHT